MKLNAAVLLMATLMLSGTVLAQSSGPSARGPQAHTLTTTGQAPNADKKTGANGPTLEKAARLAKPRAEDNTVDVNRRQKTDRRLLEHFP